MVRGPYRYHPTILYIWDTQVGINKVLRGDSAKLDDVGNGPDFDTWANYGNWNHWRCSGVWWDEEKQQNIPFGGRHLRFPAAPGKAPSVGQPWVLGNITVADPPDKVLPDGSNIFDTETEE